MFDLADLDTKALAEEGAVFELRHPDTNEPILSDGQPVSLRLAGSDSRRAKQIEREQQDRRYKRMSRKGAFELTSEENERERLERLIGCTLGWSNVYVDGQPLEFTDENAHRLFVRFDWIREAAERFVNDRANFLKASVKL